MPHIGGRLLPFSYGNQANMEQGVVLLRGCQDFVSCSSLGACRPAALCASPDPAGGKGHGTRRPPQDPGWHVLLLRSGGHWRADITGDAGEVDLREVRGGYGEYHWAPPRHPGHVQLLKSIELQDEPDHSLE